ncbi:MAG: hypothetical protein ABJF10_10605 [Chthoniobacter sp.]|uniref:hypothetical protein n=1 Tax=Chthoniobacter sp. TaxID=2510640 RepID=UPI0032A4C1F0
MQARTKRILSIVFVALFLVVVAFGYRDFDERRLEREEKTLKYLVIDSFEVRDATLDEAVQLLVEKVHAMGHPELRARVFADRSAARHFHGLLNPPPDLHPGGKITLHLTSIPLVELVKYVGGLADSTCEVIGHDLVAVPALGTSRRFRRVTYRMYPDFFEIMPEKDLTQYLLGSLTFYEEMKVDVKRNQSTVEIFAPEEQVDNLDALLHQNRLPSWWAQAESLIRYGTTVSRDY